MAGGFRFNLRTGEPIEDDDGPLLPGQGIRVPLNMKDSASLSPMQRSVMADKAARLRTNQAPIRPRETTMNTNDAAERAYLDAKQNFEDAVAAEHAKGSASAAHDSAETRHLDDERERLYQQHRQELCDAWKMPAADATPTPRNAQEGDQCTVREGGREEGGPGHLRMVGGNLVCVPDRRRQDAMSITTPRR